DGGGENCHLLRPHRLFRRLCRPGGRVRPPDHCRLWPCPGGILSPVPRLHLHRLPPLFLVRRRQALPAHHTSPHCPSRHHLPWHLLFRGYHPHQHGRGGRNRHLQGCQ